MREYWQKVHEAALAGMRKVLDGYMEVEDTCESMHKALAYVMKHGNSQEKADAIAYFNDYKWVVHEVAAHKAERAVQ